MFRRHLLSVIFGLVVLILIDIIHIWLIWDDAVVSYGAQLAHVLLDHLTERPLHSVTDAAVEQHAVGDEEHLLNGGFALGGAFPAVEELAAVGQVGRQGGVAAAVLLAALAGLHAADPPGVARVSAGQARLDGSLGAQALRVLGAVAGLQLWPAAGVIQSDERVDAVARALPPRPPDVALAGGQVLTVREVTLGLVVAPEQRLPAD